MTSVITSHSEAVAPALSIGAHDDAKRRFKDYYAQNQLRFSNACEVIENTLGLLLAAGELFPPKILSRVKTLSECIGKYERKYADSADVSAEIQDHLTDILGIQVVCIYESDIAIVSEIIRKNFDVISETDKTRSLEIHDNQFGYKGLHLDVKLNAQRLALPEYGNFHDLRFEVQIRSIVQDAWSEVDHRLKYKKRIPPDLRRRIYRLAAIFELADQEFGAIRDLTKALESEALEIATNADNKIATNNKEPLTPFNFLPVVKEKFRFYPFEPQAIDGFVDEILNIKPDYTVSSFRSVLESNLPRIDQYAIHLSGLGYRMNPFTRIRHCLAASHEDFLPLLFSGHRERYLAWEAQNS